MRTTSTFPQVRGHLGVSGRRARACRRGPAAGQPERLDDLHALLLEHRVTPALPRPARAAAIGPGRRRPRRGRARPARRGRSGSRRRRTPAPRPRPRRQRRGGDDAVVAARSSWRPPWLDTHTAATPASTHRRASSGRSTPLTTTGRPVLLGQPGHVGLGRGRWPCRRPRRRRTPGRSSPGGSRGSTIVPDDPVAGGVLGADHRCVDGEDHGLALRRRPHARAAGRRASGPAGGTPAATTARRWRRCRRRGCRRCWTPPSRCPRRGPRAAMASSPSGCTARCRVVGATANGTAAVRPSSVQEMSTSVTSRSTRGRKRTDDQAAVASATLTPSRAPWTTYSSTSGGSTAARPLLQGVQPASAHRRLRRPRRRRSSSCRGAAPARCRRSGRPAPGTRSGSSTRTLLR